ncbi:hypothetical protein [uncultured Pseudophaeobacter sp.]|jgi:hypothetical protein|uniref:hypothetical protein n=1 Tax=uncultured Pseudophaeobacter sp. TaxID=1759421 RepID=UPI0025D80E7D|nr:hypothetical protein [uncultured Pseudophaeobacter sp.]
MVADNPQTVMLGNPPSSEHRPSRVDIANWMTGAAEATQSVAQRATALEISAVEADGRTAALEERAELLEVGQVFSQIVKPTWSDLLTAVGGGDGQGGEVLDSDGGTHLAASETGYDGASVDNSGRYSWNDAWGRWVRIGNTGLSGRLDVTELRTVGSIFCSVGGTEDAIELGNDNLTGFSEGTRLRFRAVSDNSGAVTISLNGGGSFGLITMWGGPLSEGDLKAGYYYEVVWDAGPANKWRLTTMGQDTRKLRSIYAVASSVAGSENEIEVLADHGHVNGTLLAFKALYDNTSVNVTLSLNESAPFYIRGAAGAPLLVGDIKAGSWCLLRYDASGGHPWILLTSGVSRGEISTIVADVEGLQSRVQEVEGLVGELEGRVGGEAFASEALALMNKINGPVPSDAAYAASPRNPSNFFTWTDGVRAKAAPTTLKVLNFGCSSDTDLHVGKSPSSLAISGLTSAFSYLRNLEFTRTSRAVGGAFLNEYLAQIQGAAAGDYDIVMGGQLTNSVGIGAISGANDYDNYRGQLLDLFTEIRDVRNAMPIYVGCYHNHVDYPQSFPSTYRSNWPDSNQTYEVNGSHEFDAAGGRVKMINLRLYGYTLAAGDKIYFASGPGAGTYTVDTIDWDTNWITFVEAIPHTGSYTVLAKNVEVDDERVIWPANSDLLVSRDRTGNGVELMGWRTTDMVNQLTQQVCDEAGVMFWDMQKAQYLFMEKRLAENPTWTTTQLFDSVFNWVTPPGVQFNHPNAEFFEWAGQRFAGKLTTLIEDGTLHKQRVIF